MDQLPPVRRRARRRGGQTRRAARIRRVVGGRLSPRPRHPPDPAVDIDARRRDRHPQRLEQRPRRDGHRRRGPARGVPRAVHARHRHRPSGGDQRLPPAASQHARLSRRPRRVADPAAGRREVPGRAGPEDARPGRRALRGHAPYFVPVEHTRFARQRLGPGKLVAPEVGCVLDTDPVRAKAVARSYAKLYLGLRNYTRNLLAFGFTDSDLDGWCLSGSVRPSSHA
jgi:hypothetical protein